MTVKIGQTKLHSHLEATASLTTGFCLSFVVWHFLALFLGIPMPLETNFFITTVFTVVSYIRSYCFRRLFNWINIQTTTQKH